jgi:hypothetical protein
MTKTRHFSCKIFFWTILDLAVFLQKWPGKPITGNNYFTANFPTVRLHGHPPPSVQAGVSRSFRTGRLERVLQMVQPSAIRCSCIAILWVSLVSFAAITLCVASQRVFVVIYFVMTQSGNFWIYPRIFRTFTLYIKPVSSFVSLRLWSGC